MISVFKPPEDIEEVHSLIESGIYEEESPFAQSLCIATGKPSYLLIDNGRYYFSLK